MASKPAAKPKPAAAQAEPEATYDATFVVGGEKYSLSYDALTLNELAALERLAGKAFQQIDLESAIGMQGLAWIAIHRRKPDFTIEDAGNLPLSAFQDTAEPDPT